MMDANELSLRALFEDPVVRDLVLGEVAYVGLVFLALYLLLAGLAVGFLKRRAGRCEVRRVAPEGPDWSRAKTEFGWSLASIAIFGGWGAVHAVIFLKGYSNFYWEIDQYGWAWFALSPLVVFLVHDTYFYWLHRAIHTRPLAWTHQLHHRSTRPTPWACYAFHPAEAVLQGAIIPLMLLFLPLHYWILLVFVVYQTAMNVIGHLGHEFFPAWLTENRWIGWTNTTTHHQQHHQLGRVNFGLYYNLWDRLMGTNGASYFTDLRRIQRRIGDYPFARPTK